MNNKTIKKKEKKTLQQWLLLDTHHTRCILTAVLPEQTTEAVFPGAQAGTPKAVTGQLHKKDSDPEQWNRSFQISSPLSR
jgi:hypothetical protein